MSEKPDGTRLKKNLYEFYHSENQSDETITTCMLLYGPKADLDGDGYAVEVEDGFVTKGV